MSSRFTKRPLLWGGGALLLAALLFSVLLTKNKGGAESAARPLDSAGANTELAPPAKGLADNPTPPSKIERERKQAPADEPKAVMAPKAPRIVGLEELLANMREDELRRTTVLGTWTSGEGSKTCTCMAYLIEPPSKEEYSRWQELASGALAQPQEKGTEEMRKSINAIDKAFAFGDMPMYVKIMIPDQEGNQASIMTGLIENRDGISHNDDGSVSVRHLKGFKLQASDRIGNGSRFGHLVDFGSTYGDEKVPD
jgi:hypothetical protein